MIHDAVVEVTCDRKGRVCSECVFIGLEWMYRNMSESSGFWDPDDAKIEGKLVEDHGWVVSAGKHFCSTECAEAKDAIPL